MIKRIYLITTVLCFCIFQSNGNCQNSIAKSIIGNELIFKDCNKAKESLNPPDSLPLSESDKEVLTQYLGRIISLQPSSNQFIGQTPMGTSPGTLSNPLDTSHLLDPERDIRAKICSFEIIPRLYPKSSILIPDILVLASDKKSNSQLRDEAVTTLDQLLTIIQKKEYPLELKAQILSNIKLNESVLRSKLSIPFLVALSENSELPWVEMLQPLDPILRGNVLDAFVISHLSRGSDLDSILQLLQSIDDGAKAQLLLRLKPFSKNQPRLIEILPDFLASQSELVRSEGLKLLKHMANHPSFYASFFTKQNFPQISFEKYLALLKDSSESTQKDIIRTLLQIELNGDSPICKNNEMPSPTSFFINEISIDTAIFLLKKSICPSSPTHKINFLKQVSGANLSDTITSTISLLRHSEIDEPVLESLVKKLKTTKHKLAPHEYSLLLQSTLAAARQTNPIKLRPKLIELAVEGLGMQLEAPPVMGIFLEKADSPSLDILINNYENAEPILEKLLKEKSSLVRRNVLTVISKTALTKVKINKSIIKNVIKLLNDSELEIRRSSYLALKNINATFFKETLPLKESTKGSEAFYLSRIILDNENAFPKLDQLKAKDLFISSIGKLDCRELTISFPNAIKESSSTITPQQKQILENSQLGCLEDPSNTRARAIKNLISIAPLSKESESKIKDLRSIISTSTEKLSTILALDLLELQGQIPIGIESKDLAFENNLKKILDDDPSEEMIKIALNWLLKHPKYLKSIQANLEEQTTNSRQEIAILSSVLLLSIDTSVDNINRIRNSFNNNIETGKELLRTNISALPINFSDAIQHTNDKSPYFSIFLNSLFCSSLKSPESCPKIIPNYSLLLDKPDFIAASLANLIQEDLKGSEEVLNTELEITKMLISTGHFDEITPLLKNQNMIEIIFKLRKETNNLAHSKIMDYLLEN